MAVVHIPPIPASWTCPHCGPPASPASPAPTELYSEDDTMAKHRTQANPNLTPEMVSQFLIDTLTPEKVAGAKHKGSLWDYKYVKNQPDLALMADFQDFLGLLLDFDSNAVFRKTTFQAGLMKFSGIACPELVSKIPPRIQSANIYQSIIDLRKIESNSNTGARLPEFVRRLVQRMSGAGH